MLDLSRIRNLVDLSDLGKDFKLIQLALEDNGCGSWQCFMSVKISLRQENLWEVHFLAGTESKAGRKRETEQQSWSRKNMNEHLF